MKQNTVEFFKFKILAGFTAALSFLLFLALMLKAKLIFDLFSITESASGYVLAKRASLLFLANAFLLWNIRNTKSFDIKKTFCIFLVLLMGSLALLGIFEYMREQVGSGIFIAVIGEIFIVLWSAKILSSLHKA